MGGARAGAQERAVADWTAWRPTVGTSRFTRTAHAQGGRERNSIRRRDKLEAKLRVMEVSRGLAEAQVLSPEQAARYLRYVWAAGRGRPLALAGSGCEGPRSPAVAQNAEAEPCETRARVLRSGPGNPLISRVGGAPDAPFHGHITLL